MKMPRHLRVMVQAAWGALTNGYARGWLPGAPAIYEGPLKRFCVPGMNCYSCPGALGSCPIGALQAVLTSRRRRPSLYVVGYLALIGLMVGRFVCGWLCLFGLMQELLYRLPTPKITVPKRLDRALRFLKYAMLGVLVIVLPFLYRNRFDMGIPFFCQYVCPVGTLEGGIPLVLLNSAMRGALGWLFRWKFALLVLCVGSSVVIYRPFCKYVCPLGALYALFQKVSVLQLRFDQKSCVSCGRCASACEMGVDPVRTPNSMECIRCGLCVRACPQHALAFGIGQKEPSQEGRLDVVE